MPPPPGGSTSVQPGGKGGLGIALGRDQHKQISVSGLQPGMPAAVDGRIKVCTISHQIGPVPVRIDKPPVMQSITGEVLEVFLDDVRFEITTTHAQSGTDTSALHSQGTCC
jgi:hypothetical protein